MEKRTAMLVCPAEVSTSLLAAKMQGAAEAKGMKVDVFAVSVLDADNQLESKNVDVLLLGPQVRLIQDQFAEKLAPKGTPLSAISIADCDMMSGEKVFNQVEKLINK